MGEHAHRPDNVHGRAGLPPDRRASCGSRITRELDRLLVALDVVTQNFGLHDVRSGERLACAPAGAMMHYVLTGRMQIDGAGLEPVVCGPGSIAVIPSGLRAEISASRPSSPGMTGMAPPLVRREEAGEGMHDLRLLSGSILATLPGSFGLFDRLKVPIVENMSDCGIVRHAYAVLQDEISNPVFASRAVTAALVKACLLMVLRRFFSRPGFDHNVVGALANPRLAGAVAGILEDPAAPHTVASLASCAGMSRSTFARQFAEAFEMGPTEFVVRTRLHQAADMLRSTKIPIKVIAGTIGFASRSHFSRAFRDAYGRDPSAFRDDAAAPLPARAGFALEQEPG